jgi:hypothetical protein
MAVVDAVVLAVEGALLVFATQYRRRPWLERLLAAAPALAFLWIMHAARDLHGTYAEWQAYARFMAWHYPASFAQHSFEGLDGAVAGAARLGRLVLVVTLGMAELGWALLLQGRGGEQGAPHARTARLPAGDEGLELTVGPID